MKLQALKALITAGETLAVELKGEARAPLNDRDLVEAVVCLANRSGRETGWLLIGVEDDGQIGGARPRHGARTQPARLVQKPDAEKLDAAIARNLKETKYGS